MNFYPRPPRGGRRCQSRPSVRRCDISIHALREEGDDCAVPHHRTGIYFYPRPPRGGRLSAGRSLRRLKIFLSTPSARRATYADGTVEAVEVFLSTPSARRATVSFAVIALYHANFYPRPPRGGRRTSASSNTMTADISIHALREEGDVDTKEAYKQILEFLSTPSARRATPAASFGRCGASHFYPRPPRGGRPFLKFVSPKIRYFYPRPPRGGRPSCGAWKAESQKISIHALREEGDSAMVRKLISSSVFLSTPSARRATAKCQA